jgi:predicted Zn-dependent peptidase
MTSAITLLAGADGSLVRRSVLANGVRLITEFVPGVHSASIGIWVDAGSRNEQGAHMGAAHYLEHLLFKGTNARSALDISSSIEAVGGDINAFTSKEHTCYYARVLAENLPLAIDVLCDVVTDALLNAEDIEAERGVILEEIAMVDDDPSDLVHDHFATVLFGDTPLGRPILGTQETILGISRDSIVDFYRSYYQPESLVISIAGNVDHDQAVVLAESALLRAETGHFQRRGERTPTIAAEPQLAQSKIDNRPTEQAHVVMGGPGLVRGDERRFTAAVLSTILGGGMSSRLFQSVRERRGLAYSVYAYSQGFRDSGIFGIYAGCLPSKLDSVLDVCHEELQSFLRDGVSELELTRGKGQVKGSTVLGQEDTSSRMSRIGKGELYADPLLSMPEVLEKVDAVTADDINSLSSELLSNPLALSVIGPYDSIEDRPGYSTINAGV